MKYLYIFAGGKSVFFALVFLVCGIVLAFMGKLSGNYVALAGGLQALIATRAVADDYHERETSKIQQGK